METMQGLKRTAYCGELRAKDAGGRAVVAGFVQKIRDKIDRSGGKAVVIGEKLRTLYFV